MHMTWTNVDKCLRKIFSVLTALFVFAVALLALSQVAFRFIIKISVPWTEELMRALYIYIVYFGTVLVESENNQIRTTLLIDKAPKKLYIGWETIVSILSIIFNIIVLIGSVISFRTTVTYLGALSMVSSKIFFVPIIISSPFMILYQVAYMIGRFKKESGGVEK